MDRNKELQYIHSFVQESDFGFEVCRDQIRSLWTAYCLHHGLDVDTSSYFNELHGLWEVLEETEPDTADWSDYDSFDDYMCRYLV